MSNPELDYLIGKGFILIPWVNDKPAVTYSKLTKPISNIREKFGHVNEWSIYHVETVCVDVENKNGKDGKSSLSAVCAANNTTFDDLLMSTMSYRSKSNGWHLIFKGVPPARSFDDAVEFKFNSPAHCPATPTYTWINKVDPIDIPQWLIDHYCRKSSSRVDLGAPIPKGNRHNTLVSMAAMMRNANADKSMLYEFLKHVRATRVEDGNEISDEELLSIADHASKLCVDPSKNPASEERVSASTFLSNVAPVVKLPAQVKHVEVTDRFGIDERLPHIGGFIGEWVDWVEEHQPTTQRDLTMVNCLTAMACLIGRRWTFRGSFSNMYCIGVAPTSSGKEAVLQGVRRVFEDCGVSDLLGPSAIGSGEGLMNRVSSNPTTLLDLDEVGFFFQELKDVKGTSANRNTAKYLLSLYAGAQDKGRALAEGSVGAVKRPHLSIFGVAQPVLIQSNISSAMLDSGFFGRFLMVKGNSGPPLRTIRQNLNNAKIPQFIADAITKYAMSQIARMGSDLVVSNEMPCVDGVSERIHDYVNKERKKFHVEAQGDDGILEFNLAISGRNGEKINKLSLIQAYADNPESPCVTHHHVDVAMEIVRLCDEYARSLAKKESARSVGEPHKQVSFADRILKLVDRGPITAMKIGQIGREISVRERDEALKDLESRGLIVKVKRGRAVLVAKPGTKESDDGEDSSESAA